MSAGIEIVNPVHGPNTGGDADLGMHFRIYRLEAILAKTVREQIAAVDAAIAKLNTKKTELEAKVGNEINPSELTAGVQITFSYGKGDTKRVLPGVILGRKDPAEGEKGSALLKVASGTGFDALIAVIYPAQVLTVVKAEVEA